MKTIFSLLLCLCSLASMAQTSPKSTTTTPVSTTVTKPISATATPVSSTVAKPTSATATPASSTTSAQANAAKFMTYRQDILVQEYRPGQPFPGLFFESPGVPNRIGPYAIVFARSLMQYVLIFPGQRMQVSSPDYYGRGDCIGPVPAAYQEVK